MNENIEDKTRLSVLRETVAYLYESDQVEAAESVEDYIDRFDPPKPIPGTFVWWRWREGVGGRKWCLGQVHGGYGDTFVAAFGCDGKRPWRSIEWKPARILLPDDVVVEKDDAKEAIRLLIKHWHIIPAGRLQAAIDRVERVEE